MIWESGTIYGKADIFAMKELYLSGSDKTIKFLAKLVNKGHCEWSTGNLITEFNVSVIYGRDCYCVIVGLVYIGIYFCVYVCICMCVGIHT